ncbi:MAG TPA: TIGR02391 family protein, partial [Bacteroidia bacterium]|nr:TIGR02391 family protein [Bacteroidia bacterium]
MTNASSFEEAIPPNTNPMNKKLEYVLAKFKELLSKLNDSPEISQAFENAFLEIKNLARKTIELNAIDNFGKINQETITKDVLVAETKNIITNIELKLLGDTLDLSHLHPEIKKVSEGLFLKQHYREAVNNAFVRLIEIVKGKYPIIDDKSKKQKDGLDLMQDVFSKDKAKFIFSTDPNEQQGMMYLYAGAVAGIRNRYAHSTKDITEPNYALELLHFASALVRLFENKAIY